MFVFRFEHNRECCTSLRFSATGPSLTGHGPYFSDDCTTCENYPNFGNSGRSPEHIRVFERCAVTAENFDFWISPLYDYDCVQPQVCMGTGCACITFVTDDLVVPDGWELIAYWVNPVMEGIDWRISGRQVVFDPEFAVNMGAVEVADVYAFIGDGVTA